MPLPVAIVGAGLAGLAAANYLKLHRVPVTVYEAGSQIGGLARSHSDADGFTCDFGAHFINNRLAAALGISAQCREVKHYGESVLVKGETYAYPLGLLRVPRFLKDGLAAALRSKMRHTNEEGSAASWFRSHYGDALATEVALPLLEAWSGAPADELAESVGNKLKNSVPYTIFLKCMSQVSGRAIGIGYSHEMSENPGVWHVYPVGGLSIACERLAAALTSSIVLDSPVEEIHVADGRAHAITVEGKVREVSAVVSTAPAPVLARLIRGDSKLDGLRSFRFRPMIFINLKYVLRRILPNTVLWTPDRESPFFRLTETPQSMPWLAPDGRTLVTCDIGDETKGRFWTMSDDDLSRLCVEHINEMFPGTAASYIGSHVLRTTIAYPVFLRTYEPARQVFETGTGIQGLFSIGRNGEFAHILMEDVYWRTVRKMQQLVSASLHNAESC